MPLASAGYRILLVDDDCEWVSLVRLWLAQAGFNEVSVAETAHGALRAITADVPDCLILDLGLPDGEGLKVAEQVRVMPDAGGVPIIILTSQHEERVRGLAHGADHFVRKQPDGTELIATLNALFRRRDLDLGLRRFGDVALRPEEGEVFLSGRRAASLSPKAAALLLALLERAPSPVSREELSSHLQGQDDSETSRALDVMLTRLRSSLPDELAKRIRAVRGFGYVYVAPSASPP